MSRLNVNSVNPHDGIKVSITGSTNGGVVISGSGDNVTNPLLAVEGTISASGNLTASNAFFSGDIHGVGNIYVQGHATLSAYTAGGIQLGDTNTDNVTFGADINSSIIPNINNTYDLGSDAQEWRDIYVERIGYIDTITQDDASTTNTFKGDSQFMDDAGAISLFVHSADGNIGVKVADPNQELEVAGRISSSLQLSVGNSGNEIGHITGSGNLVISGTAEFLSGIETTHVTASGQISSSGTSGNYFGGTIYIDTTEAIATKGTTNSKVQMNAGQVRLFGNHASHADITIGNGLGTGGVVINESGQDQDFRIEGNTDANLLFVDAGADKIAIGTATVGNSLLTVDGDVTATHITASGDISSSGTVTAANMTTVGRHYFNAFGGANTYFTKAGDNLLIDNAGLIVNSHITASGNISSSGTAYSLFNTSPQAHFGNSAPIPSNYQLQVTGDTFLNGDLYTNSNITASGNISSSGNIHSQTSRTIGNVEVGGEAQFGTTGFQVNPPSTVYVTGDITATTNITASGNISSSGDIIAKDLTLSGNLDLEGGLDVNGTTNLDAVDIDGNVSSSATIGALVLHGRNNASAVVNSGGAVNTTITEATFPGGTVFGVNQSTAGNAVAFTLPAATAGLEYTFIASVTSGNTSTTISAPSAILKGMAICKDGNEDISGTNFIFAATKFEIGTRVTCIADGAIWHVTAICPCDVADVSTT